MDGSSMTTDTFSIEKIEADEGYVLTNGETYSKLIYLGINDSPDNWHEIPEDEVPKSEGEQ